MPSQKSKPVAQKTINGPVLSIQQAFTTLFRHLKEAGKTDDGWIQCSDAAESLRDFLKAHRKNGTSIEEKFVIELVALLEYQDGGICHRLHSTTFTVIVEAILQTDHCQACERGLYLLAASLHQEDPQTHPEIQRQFMKKRKYDIGKHCLVLLFDCFVDVDGSSDLRRWIGILGLQLLKGNAENVSCMELGPDRIRQGLGKMLTTESNEIVRFVAGKVINALREADVPLKILWPANAPPEEYEKFPQQSQDGWSQQFQTYLDDTPVLEGRVAEPNTLLYFATDCLIKYGLNPSQQLRCLGHSLNVTLNVDFLTIHAPSSEDWPDKILEIPVPSITKLMLRGYPESQSGIACVYFVRGEGTAPCTLNGKEEEVVSIRLCGPLDMVYTMAEDFEKASPLGKKLHDEIGHELGASDFDETDDETDSHPLPIKKDAVKAFSQEAVMLGSEVGSEVNPHDDGDMEQHPAALAVNDDDEIYDVSPRGTNTTQSPDELDHTRESNSTKKKDNPNIETEADTSQSTSQCRKRFGKKGPFPSKSKSQAQAQNHVQDQIEHEVPAAILKAKGVESSKPQIGSKARVATQPKKLDDVGKRNSQKKSQTQDESGNSIAVSTPKVAAKSKPKTGTQSKVGSQPKNPNVEVEKKASQAKKRAQAEADEPAPAPKAMKSKSKTGTQGKAASQFQKLDTVAGKRTSRSNPQNRVELDEPGPKAKPAAMTKLHTDTHSKAGFQLNKSRVLATGQKVSSQSESQTTTSSKHSVPKIKPRAKAPIILPSQQNSQRNMKAKRASDISATTPAVESPDSESFQVSDEHNASTPKPSQAVKHLDKTIVSVHAQAERTKDKKEKKASEVPMISDGNTAGDEYDLPPSSDNEAFDTKSKKSFKVKKGSAKKYGKAGTKKAVPQQMQLFQDNSSAKAKPAAGRGRPRKPASTNSSQLDEVDDLQVPPPGKNPPRKSQEVNKRESPPKVPRASKIPVARGKTEKIPIRKTEPPVQVEDKNDEVTPAPVMRNSRQTVLEPDEANYEEPPMAGAGDEDNVAGAPLPQEDQNPDVSEVSLNQSQPKTTEKSHKSTKKLSPKEIAEKMSHIINEAIIENSPELRAHADLADMGIDQPEQEPLHDPMDGLDDQNDLGQTPIAHVGNNNVSPVKASMESGESKASRKRKAEIEEVEPAKKRRSFVQEGVQNVSSQQKVDAQTHNTDGKANKSASEHHFKKPAVPRKLEAKKTVDPFLETQAKPVAINEESSYNNSLSTPAEKGREGSVAAAGEKSNVPLVDDSVHRKATLIAFNKSGPMNSGRLSVTPNSHVEAFLISSSAKENLPAKKRKLDEVERVDEESPPSKRQQSSPVQQEDEAMVEGNFGDFDDIDNGSARSSSPAPTSPAAAMIIPQKRHSSQPSRVDENGSPLPLGGVVNCDQMGIDGKIKDPNQPKHRNVPVVQGPFKANQFFGTKAKIGSQNKARPGSPEHVELRYIPHQKLKSGNYEGVVGKEVVQPEQLVDPFTEPHTRARKSSGFTERLRSESSKPGVVAEQTRIITKPQSLAISNSFRASNVDGGTQLVADVQTGKTKKKDTRLAIDKIKAALPGTDDYAAQQALLVCGGGVKEAINALVASRATKLSSKKAQLFVDDPEKTLIGGGMDVPGLSSDGSTEDSNSDPVRSPLQEISSNETWNVALRPHYRNLKDAVHRVADEMIIRLANEEDQMGLLVKQYQEGGAKIVDDLVQKRTEEKKEISNGLMTKKCAMIKAYKASNKAIAKVVEATRNNPVSHFAEGWKARQAAIREKICKGRGAD